MVQNITPQQKQEIQVTNGGSCELYNQMSQVQSDDFKMVPLFRGIIADW